MGFQNFLKSISPKVNVIAPMRFELARYKFSVQLIRYAATGIYLVRYIFCILSYEVNIILCNIFTEFCWEIFLDLDDWHLRNLLM